jgi:glycosyltransferase involved in cell wall biosynthesis
VSAQHDEWPVSPETTNVTILGVHVKSEGYPNVTFRIRDLERASKLRTREINFPFRAKSTRHGIRSRRWAPLQLPWAAIRLIYVHLCLFLAYFWHGRPSKIYIPYPSTLVLFFLSLLPKFLRPAYIVADCFISLYDTVVTDRGLIASNSWAARILKSLESRAYRTADVIVVDTDLNANYFIETFGLAASKVMALPLSIDESVFRSTPYLPNGNSCTVLFIGTFVPLQGADIIAQTAVMLGKRRDVRFRLIGSGQTARAVERIFATERPANVEWVTQWMDSNRLAEEIRGADICLGIFGTGPKAQRVWPLKNYAYMAIGRPIITGDTLLARHMLEESEPAPFLTVPNGNPATLAAAIVDLAQNPERRKEYAKNARLFYDKNLNSHIALERLVSRLARAPDETS